MTICNTWVDLKDMLGTKNQVSKAYKCMILLHDVIEKTNYNDKSTVAKVWDGVEREYKRESMKVLR